MMKRFLLSGLAVLLLLALCLSFSACGLFKKTSEPPLGAQTAEEAAQAEILAEPAPTPTPT